MDMLRPGGAEDQEKGAAVPGTYTQLLFHIVFSTKRRDPSLTDGLRDRLFAYMGGIIRAERGTPLAIGGVEDHVHLLIRWRPDGALSDLMRTLKARSSVWVHKEYPDCSAFAWQEGYAAFTVSVSQEEAVKRYIAGQREHHAREDFISELRRLLVAHGVEFEERYALD